MNFCHIYVVKAQPDRIHTVTQPIKYFIAIFSSKNNKNKSEYHSP